MSKKEQMDKQNESQEHQELVAEQEQSETVEDFTPEHLSPDEHQEVLANIQSELALIQKDYEDLQDKYRRLYAEFDNHRKRTEKEKIDLMKSASQDIMPGLLPVLDDFDRAKQNEPLSEGLTLVYQKLYKVLQNKGLEPMESTGEPFNPELHEALTEIPAPDDAQKGKIIDTLEKGYLLGNKIIRHAKVVVGK